MINPPLMLLLAPSLLACGTIGCTSCKIDVVEFKSTTPASLAAAIAWDVQHPRKTDVMHT